MKKLEVSIGLAGIAVLLAMVIYYQKVCYLEAVQEPVLTETEPEENILTGYEAAEDAAAYVLRQIRSGNLDGSLRGCAVGEVAEYFYMEGYLEYTEDFKGTGMIPPADNDDEAYIEISRMRLAYSYAQMITKCMDVLSSGESFEICNIVIDEPENPDGMYFQRQNAIKTILGAKEICEITAYAEVDQTLYELHFSLAKYAGSLWKVVLFNTTENYESTEPDIRVSEATPLRVDSERWNAEDGTVLPLNYDLIKGQSEKDADELVENFLIYLQRGDILSAMTYFDLGSQSEEPVVSLELLEKQNAVAVKFQELYYGMFLADEEEVAWAGRHFEDEPGYIPKLLVASNLILASSWSPLRLEESEGTVKYQFGFSYRAKGFKHVLTLSEGDTCKILSME